MRTRRCRVYSLSLSLSLGVCLNAQGVMPVVNPLAPSSFSYYSYSTTPKPLPPAGTQMQIPFPNQTAGGQLTIPACSTYENLKYSHYAYIGPGYSPTPVTGPVYGYFSNFFSSTKPVTGWDGFIGNMSFGGSVGANNSPSTQNFIQSVYFSTDSCYETGAEIGFYRLLINSNTSAEEGTVYFYYGMDVNCVGGVNDAGSCRDRVTGDPHPPHYVAIPLTIPSLNSAGGTNFIYSVYLIGPATFHITITDPYSGASIITPQDIGIDPGGFFAATAAQAFTQGLTGYLTVTQQRNSTQGGITEAMSSPLKLTIYSLAQIAMVAAASAQPYSRAQGDCMQGKQTITVSGIISSSTTPVMRSYPGCTVTVHLAGTNTLAGLYSDSSGTPKANPFTADAYGRWFFYSANGGYDVTLTGVGSTYTIGDVPVFNIAAHKPHALFAYPLSSVPGIIGVYNSAGNHYAGFTAGALNSDVVWTLPTQDAQGCLYSNGSGTLSFYSCISASIPVNPSGVIGSVQFNDGGVFSGDANLIWNKTAQRLSIVGIGGSSGLAIANGYVISSGGYISAANSWQGFNTNTDGMLVRGVHVAPTADGLAGGYLNIAPLGYGTVPLPLAGLSAFGSHTGLVWVSGTNTASPDTTLALNTNLYIDAAGGFSTSNTPFNSIQARLGGMFAKSFTAQNYMQIGTSNGVPSTSQFDEFQPGAVYFDTVLNGIRVYNGSDWMDIGTGGGGGSGAGGSNTQIQFNNGGVFAGSPNLTWASGQLSITGSVVSSVGFLSNGVLTNTIQAPNGGVAGKWVTASDSVMWLEESTPPLSDLGQVRVYADSAAHALKISVNGGAYTALGSGTGTPGGVSTNVQYNASGVLAGTGNFAWDNTNKLLTVTTADSTHSGMAVANGFMQADAGFYATIGTATLFNAIQAPGGGMQAKSFTASKYIQMGTSAGAPALTSADALHAGMMYWDTGTAGVQVYNGSGWISLGGGTGSPGGANTDLQYNSSGSFAGTSNLTWNNTGKLLTVTANNSSSAGIVVGTGFIQSDQGFIATSGVATNFNAVQAPTGGMAANSFTAVNYLQTGHGTISPSPTGFDTFHPGALYYDDSAACLKVYNGSSWNCIGGGGGSPGGANTQIQYNSSGAFGGNANFTWNNSTQLLNVVGIASTAGMNVQNGFMQSDGGFVVNSSNQYNSVHTTAGGGMAGRSFTASAYIQTGTSAGAPTTTTADAFHAGALYWDTGTSTERLYTGAGWVDLATSTMGVLSINSLTGIVTLAGTANEIVVTPSGSTLTLSTPQPIATTSNVTFGTVAATTFNATATTSTIAFQTANSNFSVNGYGDVSANGQINIVGTNDAVNGSDSSALKVNGIQAISNTRAAAFTGLTLSGKLTTYNGVGTVGYGMSPIIYDQVHTGTSAISTTQVTQNGAGLPAGLYRVNVTASCIYPGSGGIAGALNISIGAVPDGNYYAVPLFQFNCLTGSDVDSRTYVLYTNGTSSSGCNGICYSATSSSWATESYRVDVVAEKLR